MLKDVVLESGFNSLEASLPIILRQAKRAAGCSSLTKLRSHYLCQNIFPFFKEQIIKQKTQVTFQKNCFVKLHLLRNSRIYPWLSNLSSRRYDEFILPAHLLRKKLLKSFTMWLKDYINHQLDCSIYVFFSFITKGASFISNLNLTYF